LKKIIAIIALIVVGGGGFGVWYYFVRDDAPEELAVTTRTTTANNPSASGPDGKYSVQLGADTTAGFRINEQFGPLDHTAVVRTDGVSGSFTLAGSTITDVTFSVDMTKLESKDDQPDGVFPVANRIDFLKDDGLETSKFPTATFSAASVQLTAAPVKGAKVTVDASGKLTIHGVTKEVTIPLTATWNGEIIDIQGSLAIALADYDMTPPAKSFVEVEGNGTLEFKAALAKA
jgi:polyisoprenoid-binding protein YceI